MDLSDNLKRREFFFTFQLQNETLWFHEFFVNT